MITFPNAKINLGLKIVNKRSDGFHNLESCFYPVPLQDALELIEAEKIAFTTSGIEIPGNEENNLCIKAWKTVHAQYNIPPVHIHLHKNIPIGAGLGGGSSDAAFTVKLLNEMYNLNLSNNQMEDLVRPLGSDCAFFIQNKPVLALEKGDLFSPIDINISGKWLVLAFPNIHISTQEAYKDVQLSSENGSIIDILSQNYEVWRQKLENSFEKHLFLKYPVLPELKSLLYKEGAVYAAMTGSGSCMYGIFESEPELKIIDNANLRIEKFRLI